MTKKEAINFILGYYHWKDPGFSTDLVGQALNLSDYSDKSIRPARAELEALSLDALNSVVRYMRAALRADELASAMLDEE